MGVVKIFLGFVIAFLLISAGWQMNDYVSQAYAQELVQPQNMLNSFDSQSKILNEREKPSPQDWIKEEQIHVYKDKIIIDLPNARWAKFTDTNSMDPLFDKGNNALQIVPENAKQLAVGDIITYQSSFIKDSVIHRIIQISGDEKGWYAITKGDNNDVPDPERVRFEQVKKVLVGVIY